MLLLEASLVRALLQMGNGGARPRHHSGRQRGGEDEAGGQRAHRVDQRARARNVTAKVPKRLAIKSVQKISLGDETGHVLLVSATSINVWALKVRKNNVLWGFAA